MRQWLRSDAVIAPEGAVLSWSNPRHPGYPYAEAAGLLLGSFCSTLGPQVDGGAADRVAAWLNRVIAADGGVGRDDTRYLFDSGVALAGLLRYRSAGGRIDVEQTIHRLRAFVCDQIDAGVSVQPLSSAADGRWSTQFGAHLVKCLHSLHLYARTFGEPLRQDLVERLINGSGHQPSPVYLHPFCYEQEGHLIVEQYRLANLFEPIDGALEWLSALQQPDGGILAFANGMEGFGEPRTDATAQAARLWVMRDRSRYAREIERALAFLASCQTAGGGIRYSPSRDDVCSWSTMFTLQAVEWFLDEPRLDELL